MSEAVIQARGLTRWYGQVIAVNKVDIDIEPGITAMLGPNGAGKSTILKMFTGQMQPSQGELRVLGEPIWGNHSLFTRIGLSPEHDNFHEDMSGQQFVALMGRLAGHDSRAAKARSKAMLDRVGLPENAWKRPLRTYSKGMRQRVKLAQALIHEPELLFLDEPMNGLDPVGRHDMQRIMRGLADEGKSVIVSTHILHEVESLTDRMLLLAHGRVLAQGDVHEIRAELEEHPYAIRIACDRPRRVSEILLGNEWVDSARIIDEVGQTPAVVVQTNRADRVFDALPKLLLDEGIRVQEISSPDDNIESVFEYLIHG